MAHLPILPPSTSTLSWATLLQHPRVHEMLGSILTGMALGLVVLLLLSAYPGEPFDYSKPDGGRAEREAAMAGKYKKEELEEEEEEEDMDKVEVRVAADGCGSTLGSSSSSGSISSTTTTMTTMTSVRHRRSHSKGDSKSTRGRNGSSSSSSSSSSSGSGDDGQHAKAEALHRLLIQEDRVWQRLQHLPPAVRGMLGLSEDGVRLAVRQAGGSAGVAGLVDHGRLSSRIDLVFYLLAFSALVYVLNMEYGHVATRLFTRYFFKEAAVLGF